MNEVEKQLILEISRFWQNSSYRMPWISLSAIFGLRGLLDDRLIRDQFWGNYELPQSIRSYLQRCIESRPVNARLLLRFVAIEIVSSFDEEYSGSYPTLFKIGNTSFEAIPELEDLEEIEALIGQISYLWGEFGHIEDWKGIATVYGLDGYLDNALLRHQHFGDWNELSEDIFTFLLRCYSANSKQTRNFLNHLATNLVDTHRENPSFGKYSTQFALLVNLAEMPLEEPAELVDGIEQWLEATRSGEIDIELKVLPQSDTEAKAEIVHQGMVPQLNGATDGESSSIISCVDTESNTETTDELVLLKSSFEEVAALSGQKRGYAFEDFIHDEIFQSEGLEHKGPYRPPGEQIDGYVIVHNNHFLIEAKWEEDNNPASDVYTLEGKVRRKLRGTLGIFWSMSGYSDDAIRQVEKGQLILLFDRSDLEGIVNKEITFTELCREKFLRAKSHGDFYFPWSKMKKRYMR